MLRSVFLIVFSVFFLSSSSGLASPRPKLTVKSKSLKKQPLSFLQWRRLQVHSAKTHLKRLKASKNNKIRTKKRFKRAYSRLAYAKALKFEDYASVYLIKFADNDRALKQIAKSLSDETVTQILKQSLKKKSSKRR